MKNLEKATTQEQIDFINSFDYVLSDMDGVIWVGYKEIPGAADCLESLKKLGKPVKFVTNNDFTNATSITKKLELNNFQGYTTNDVVHPTLAMIDYLKKMKFNRKIYIAASKACRNAFEKAGFTLAGMPPDHLEENLDAFLAELDDDEDVGCVIVNMDFNLTIVKLQKCLTFLKRKDCIWLVGPIDKKWPAGAKGPILGMHHIVDALKEISGRDYILLGKPSQNYNEYIEERFNFVDPRRVLFIGDTIIEDMRVAANGGYKKLLVLTGISKIGDVENWSNAEELKPDYYIDSLKSLDNIIKNVVLKHK